MRKFISWHPLIQICFYALRQTSPRSQKPIRIIFVDAEIVSFSRHEITNHNHCADAALEMTSYSWVTALYAFLSNRAAFFLRIYLYNSDTGKTQPFCIKALPLQFFLEFIEDYVVIEIIMTTLWLSRSAQAWPIIVISPRRVLYYTLMSKRWKIPPVFQKHCLWSFRQMIWYYSRAIMNTRSPTFLLITIRSQSYKYRGYLMRQAGNVYTKGWLKNGPLKTKPGASFHSRKIACTYRRSAIPLQFSKIGRFHRERSSIKLFIQHNRSSLLATGCKPLR